MLHIDYAKSSDLAISDDFLRKASGRYYTGEPVGRRLAFVVAKKYLENYLGQKEISVVDPFGGDGRLLGWLIEAWTKLCKKELSWKLQLWDISDIGFQSAKARFEDLSKNGIKIDCQYLVGDAFSHGVTNKARFDVVITNPPWELLKPDRREIDALHTATRDTYVSNMRAYDVWLSEHFPRSQPRRKFAGWGTNLSRVGFELSLSIARIGGLVGAVMPASLMADDQSTGLRKYILTENSVSDIAYYPAEAKHYDNADVASITLLVEAGKNPSDTVSISTFGVNDETVERTEVHLDRTRMSDSDYVLPVAFGAGAVSLLEKITSQFSSWADLECDPDSGFWAGREVDETGSNKWLASLQNSRLQPFLKGRMIDRYALREKPSLGVAKKEWLPPKSVQYERIAWRDVSRPNQKRRIIATIVPSGWVLGNSLGVAFFSRHGKGTLRSLLGVINSTVFEFMLRAHLATGHVSLTSLRKVSLPSVSVLEKDEELQRLVQSTLEGNSDSEIIVDAYVALNLYGLTLDEYLMVIDLFPKIDQEEKILRQCAFEKLLTKTTVNPLPRDINVNDKANKNKSEHQDEILIFNHCTARLSALDLQMVRALPEGGNWKDIPVTIPSKRLEQIRESYARGEGSRSTYYGRLRREMPSYTINTYFNRPGNGCHVHPVQNRVLSQREAARLQSFPDAFEFVGTQGAICNQIGNAVPPLLAYRIATTLGSLGSYIDLFSGAGGMGLGFKWAGWEPIVANDIEPKFLATYMRNVHENAVTGSITDPGVFRELVSAAKQGRRSNKPLWVLGGPPCQGFSTAGSRRSMEDPRNHLFSDYVRFLEEVRPDGFVFENVTGLLNMQGGKVFSALKEAFSSVMPAVYGTVVAAHEHGVPQRRKRVILVGYRDIAAGPWTPPNPITSMLEPQTGLFGGTQRAVSVEEALWDLPSLEPGEDGSNKPYLCEPKTIYQALMRGKLTTSEYFDLLASGARGWEGR